MCVWCDKKKRNVREHTDIGLVCVGCWKKIEKLPTDSNVGVFSTGYDQRLFSVTRTEKAFWKMVRQMRKMKNTPRVAYVTWTQSSSDDDLDYFTNETIYDLVKKLSGVEYAKKIEYATVVYAKGVKKVIIKLKNGGMDLSIKTLMDIPDGICLTKCKPFDVIKFARSYSLGGCQMYDRVSEVCAERINGVDMISVTADCESG